LRLLKELFHIGSSDQHIAQEVLSIRLGEKHCSFAITNKAGDNCSQLVYCRLENWNEQELSDWKAAYPVLGKNYYKIQVAYDNPQALLMPAWCFKPEDTRLFLQSVSGDLYGSHVVSEIVPGWQLYTIYGMPREVEDWMSQQFPTCSFRHQYSLALKDVRAMESGCLLVDFRTDEFTLLAARGSHVLLARTYAYSAPEDVLYYLLKICDEFKLKQQDVQLLISGLIDRQSNLYRELHQYFLHLRLREPVWDTSEHTYPAHFFTSLNDLAACAS
jgi:hypothetical protein